MHRSCPGTSRALNLSATHFAINLALDVRHGFFGESGAPSRDDCWSQRRGGLGGFECNQGHACGGQLHISYHKRNFVALNYSEPKWIQIPSDSFLQREVDLTVTEVLPNKSITSAFVIWLGLWYIAGDYTDISTGAPRIRFEVPVLLRSLYLASTQGRKFTSVVGSSYPWCSVPVKRTYCPKQGPESMRELRIAMGDAMSLSRSASYIDIFEASRAAGLENFSPDGTHPGRAINLVVFEMALHSWGF